MEINNCKIWLDDYFGCFKGSGFPNVFKNFENNTLKSMNIYKLF